jgi:hypothetical protein
MVMSRDQDTGRSHSLKTHNDIIQGAEELKYFGTSVSNQNPINEKLRAD